MGFLKKKKMLKKAIITNDFMEVVNNISHEKYYITASIQDEVDKGDNSWSTPELVKTDLEKQIKNSRKNIAVVSGDLEWMKKFANGLKNSLVDEIIFVGTDYNILNKLGVKVSVLNKKSMIEVMNLATEEILSYDLTDPVEAVRLAYVQNTLGKEYDESIMTGGAILDIIVGHDTVACGDWVAFKDGRRVAKKAAKQAVLTDSKGQSLNVGDLVLLPSEMGSNKGKVVGETPWPDGDTRIEIDFNDLFDNNPFNMRTVFLSEIYESDLAKVSSSNQVDQDVMKRKQAYQYAQDSGLQPGDKVYDSGLDQTGSVIGIGNVPAVKVKMQSGDILDYPFTGTLKKIAQSGEFEELLAQIFFDVGDEVYYNGMGSYEEDQDGIVVEVSDDGRKAMVEWEEYGNDGTWYEAPFIKKQAQLLKLTQNSKKAQIGESIPMESLVPHMVDPENLTVKNCPWKHRPDIEFCTTLCRSFQNIECNEHGRFIVHCCYPFWAEGQFIDKMPSPTKLYQNQVTAQWTGDFELGDPVRYKEDSKYIQTYRDLEPESISRLLALRGEIIEVATKPEHEGFVAVRWNNGTETDESEKMLEKIASKKQADLKGQDVLVYPERYGEWIEATVLDEKEDEVLVQLNNGEEFWFDVDKIKKISKRFSVQKQADHNGWTNWDTHEVVLIVMNTEQHYFNMIALRPFDSETARLFVENYEVEVNEDVDYDKVNWNEVAEAFNEE